jgi:phosphopantothenoylcysteine decarboxylase
MRTGTMNIILGITGSVAATLTPKLTGILLGADHSVRIVATTPALYFLSPDCYDPNDDTIQVHNNGENCRVDLFKDKDEWPAGGYHKNDPVKHINFRDWADLLLIAPLSANTLAKMANGDCDNFLACIFRAWPKAKKPVVLAPAMNTEMWLDPITSEHLEALKKRCHRLIVIDPVSKRLACGDYGIGAMADIATIADTVSHI